MGGRPLDESELVERAKRGDVQAYEVLVRTHQQVAFRTAYVVAGGAADAQDAVQEAFVKAYYAIGRFREGNAFRPWLLRIVANEAINRRRSAKRHLTLATRAAEGRPPGDAVPSPEGVALEQERRREVVGAVGKLRPEDRLVIAYRFWFEMSEEEMAEALGCARGTVKSRLSRALGRLRKVLEAGSPSTGSGEEQVMVDG
jgi:RNA polymerase sigma-70 factor (ECF subfamily)